MYQSKMEQYANTTTECRKELMPQMDHNISALWVLADETWLRENNHLTRLHTGKMQDLHAKKLGSLHLDQVEVERGLTSACAAFEHTAKVMLKDTQLHGCSTQESRWDCIFECASLLETVMGSNTCSIIQSMYASCQNSPTVSLPQPPAKNSTPTNTTNQTQKPTTTSSATPPSHGTGTPSIVPNGLSTNPPSTWNSTPSPFWQVAATSSDITMVTQDRQEVTHTTKHHNKKQLPKRQASPPSEQPVPNKKSKQEKEKYTFVRGAQNILSNLAPTPLSIDNIHYATVEHAYQAQKARHFKEFRILHRIQSTTNPLDAKQYTKYLTKSNQTPQEQRPLFQSWHKKRVQVLHDSMKQKFDQNSKAKCTLLETNNDIILHNVLDQFWGTGHNNTNIRTNLKGSNHFGNLLTIIRATYRGEPNPDYTATTAQLLDKQNNEENEETLATFLPLTINTALPQIQQPPLLPTPTTMHPYIPLLQAPHITPDSRDHNPGPLLPHPPMTSTHVFTTPYSHSEENNNTPRPLPRAPLLQTPHNTTMNRNHKLGSIVPTPLMTNTQELFTPHDYLEQNSRLPHNQLQVPPLQTPHNTTTRRKLEPLLPTPLMTSQHQPLTPQNHLEQNNMTARPVPPTPLLQIPQNTRISREAEREPLLPTPLITKTTHNHLESNHTTPGIVPPTPTRCSANATDDNTMPQSQNLLTCRTTKFRQQDFQPQKLANKTAPNLKHHTQGIQTLILGDSQLQHVTDAIHNTPTTIISISGATFELLTTILHHTDTMPDIHTLVLAVGINNHAQDPASTSLKNFTKMIHKAKLQFPNAQIFFPNIPYHPNMKIRQHPRHKKPVPQNHLKTLMIRIRAWLNMRRYSLAKNVTLLELPNAELNFNQDNYHLNTASATHLVNHWTRLIRNF